MKCPKCNSNIYNENINISSDIAYCSKCNYVFKISENIKNIEGYFEDGFDENDPPDGAWFKTNFNSTIIGATTRSKSAFILIPFTLVWSGTTLWFSYGIQLINGEFSLYKTLFGIPFLIGTIILCSFALMAIWGKIELTLDDRGGRIFTGIRDIGFVKKFKWSDVKTVKELRAAVGEYGASQPKIVLEGKRQISFGAGLTDDRRYYLIRAIKKIMSKKKRN